MRIFTAIAAVLLTLPANATDWKATEIVKHYAISGTTGRALYESIGQNGPVIGKGRRTIALTNWDLKWRRDYQPKGSSCTLVSALPLLTITYELPKPKAKLTGATARNWQAFSDGITAHEKIHGILIRDRTAQIISATVGLTIANDPKCRKIRDAVQDQVRAVHERYQAETRAFEQDEMRPGGNVQKLVLQLVNG
jgi:predicted secreted Zn-dependent protease